MAPGARRSAAPTRDAAERALARGAEGTPLIAFLQGALRHRDAASVVVLAGGVGYELRMPAGTADALGPIGAEVELWVHTSVKEDALDLFGFRALEERALFRLLLEVPKVGPALALLLMGSLPPDELAAAVRTGEVARLTRVKGIGKKTAENLLFHLKDRVLEIAATSATLPRPTASSPAHPGDELVAALLGLGYRQAQAEQAAAKARERLPAGDLGALVREALKLIRAG